MRAIADLGFETPSPIQALALPVLLGQPTDFIGLAATGTGKTGAFAIPMLERITPSKRFVQGLILCPTRELALQVAGQIDLMGKHLGVKAVAIYGGSSFGDQIRGLRQGAQIVVGTPGRILDHLERGTLKLDQITTVVLDEADEMISMGFREALEMILDAAPKEDCNKWLFSATMSRDVRAVADHYLSHPKQVQINKTEMLSTTVEQYYYMTHESDKPEILCKLLDVAEDHYGLIFCQTKALVVDLTEYLNDCGYRVDCLHGDMDQTARERTMRSFRERRVSLLVCTDVASRGIDVKDITHVINYSLPRELDNYVHRIGRTARSGKTGLALNLVTPSHRGLISRIEKMTKSRMKEGKIPTRKDVGTRKVLRVLDAFKEEKNFKRAQELLNHDWLQELEKMDSKEVASRFLALMHQELFTDHTRQ